MTDELMSVVRATKVGYSLPQALYCQEDAFTADMECVVKHKWLLVDHVSRIPKPGQYFLYEVGQESLILVRENEETVNAFYNVCRHRGSLLCLEQEGTRQSLTCPYHAWSYNLDGSLKNARSMPEDFDFSKNSLHPCHIRVWHGLIFINLSAGEAPEFDQEFSILEPWLTFHGFETAKIAHRAAYPTHANWKLVVENFLECYHCVTAHREFCSRHAREALVAFGAGPSSGPVDVASRFAPVLKAWEAKAAKLGRPMGSVDDDAHSGHMKFYIQRPHREDILSETEDGQPVACLMGHLQEFDRGRMHLSFSPLNHMIACNDFAALIRFTPKHATLTDVDIIWLVDGKARDVDVERMIWIWDVTTRQDKTIVENNQRGINSSRYQPGRYSDQERKVITFTSWYLNQLRASLETAAQASGTSFMNRPGR